MFRGLHLFMTGGFPSLRVETTAVSGIHRPNFRHRAVSLFRLLSMPRSPFRPSIIWKGLTLCALTLLFATRSSAQVFSITQPSISTCTGALLDSGGEGASGYSNNESYTTTICPDDPGHAISLSFITLNLSLAGSLPVDNIVIYDGPDASSPVMATLDGSDSPGIFTASFGNTSGCLTVQFTSNETGTGVFAASISCTVPCEPPVAVGAMSETNPAWICQGDVVNFDGSASHGVNGHTIVQYIWDLDNGVVDSTSGPYVSHVFGPPGESVVHLTVVDDNDCASTNPVDLQLLVSTTPFFAGMADQTLCVGETATLDATGTHAVTWTGIPNADFGEGIELPDDLGTPFISTLNFTEFAPGATLNNINLLQDICINMEHSFMGDFVLQLTSPTGQTVVFHQQGGGGTFLGDANDSDEGDPQPGTCWQYCFSPTATNGTWTDNSLAGNTVPVSQGQALPAGTYESDQPLTGFLGSALNGTWTLRFTDLWGADNGFICSWSMDFDPSLYPDVTVYTPTLGLDVSDSAWWSGPDLTTTSNPLIATATPTVSGNPVYTFTVVDNFGCTYDTTLTLHVTPGANFEATAGPPCHGPVLMGEHFEVPIPTGVLIYQWSPSTGLSNPSTAHPTASPTADTWYHLHVYPTGHPLCGIVDSVFVPKISILTNDSVIVDPLCHGQTTGTIAVETQGNGGPWDYTWSDGYGTVVRSTSASNGDTFTGPAGTYFVRITEGPNGSGCQDSLNATITEPALLELTSITADTTICLTGLAHVEAGVQGGTAPLALNWDQGLAGDGPFDVSPVDTVTYTVYATDANNCQTQPWTMTVNVRPALSFVLPDTLPICPNVDTTLTATQVMGGDGTYFFDWGAGPQPNDMRAVNLPAPQHICVTVSDGCETPPVQKCTWFAVKSLPPLILTADTTLGCAPFAVHFEVQDTTGGAHVDWDFGDGSTVDMAPPSRDHGYTRSGHFTVSATVHWPNYCADSTSIPALVVVEPMPDADFTWSPEPVSVLDPRVQFTEAAGPYATQWVWTFPEEDTVHARTAEYTFPGQVGGTYPVTLWTANYLGCADSVTKMIEVHDSFIVYAPNAFSPDGDGINDQFFIRGNDLSPDGFELTVFDRWGHSLFSTDDVTHPWDGSGSGGAIPQGVYVWRVKARSAYTGHDYEYLGHVTLVR